MPRNNNKTENWKIIDSIMKDSLSWEKFYVLCSIPDFFKDLLDIHKAHIYISHLFIFKNDKKKMTLCLSQMLMSHLIT